MGGLSPLYPVRPKAYCEKKDMSLWSLLQAACKGVSFVVGGVVNPDMGNILEGKTHDVRSFAAVGEVERTPSTEESSAEKTEGSQKSPPVKNVSSGDEDFACRLSQKCKTGLDAGSKGSSKAPILMPTAPALSRAKGKALEASVDPTDPVVEASPTQATGTSKFKLPECFHPRSPLAPLFAEGLPIAYVLK
ncbi:hypothetical protein HanRHA438_Chr07g0301001 [Helianthus annuus]|uniref:Uncharacterized protein n=1 Tax=Helianthus annuus TaxID=4232 RepID=A0A9K3IKT7_HELAN|nr:hypothetical protein HanXRQr2_Chr07g0290541 [Helianthus annuus]KAJ0549869.1 hypothetical protein HanHA300_Chr07g0238921 [Helianthus annuus]KAJ0556400.1 hypothetical protein HanIR_Chr07g0313391 [Helianthus annuus]KAJ0562827.1 hypothetical protein HanHA89_Chr07g0256121 [Helianthus annuus]KAJ0730967.1 hypothetical protein HanOQP8_Chr07g0246511 [Helianthus annuus]